MKRMIIVFWVLLIVMVSLSAVFADDYGHITPANLGRAYRLYDQGRRQIWIASTHKPARIIVNRPTAQHAETQPRLVEVQLGSTTIYLDPDADYTHQGEYPIGDENHLLAAQRLIRSAYAKPARVVRNPNSGTATHRAVIHPQMILLKPEMLLRPNQRPRLKKIEIPSVPAPPKKKARLMVITPPISPSYISRPLG